MSEQDFSKRLVVVVRKDLLPWQAANAVAHISAYIGNRLGESFGTGSSFITADKKDIPRNSQYPMILKRANSSEQLHNVLAKVKGEHLVYIAFIREMIDTTDDAEIEKILKTKKESELDILGLGVFGLHDQVNAITKKFGLWE